MGILEKPGGRTWCFDGQFVVECVVNVDRKQPMLWWANVGQVCEVYFWEFRFGTLQPRRP